MHKILVRSPKVEYPLLSFVGKAASQSTEADVNHRKSGLCLPILAI